MCVALTGKLIPVALAHNRDIPLHDSHEIERLFFEHKQLVIEK
jgi:hypothetical protein